jgi:hypothetical protein
MSVVGIGKVVFTLAAGCDKASPEAFVFWIEVDPFLTSR